MKIPAQLQNCAGQVMVNGVTLGGPALAWLAGPCTIASEETLRATAAQLKAAGVSILRGGLFKPRTSPYSFQGMREEGIAIVRRVKQDFGLAFISEALDAESLQLLMPVLDIIQIGSRNCLNYELLKAAGRTGKPVMLKRGFAVTVEEWLNAAEYLAAAGCHEILLCERGIRTMTEVTRFSLDVGTIAWLRQNLPCPILADPSHAAGCTELVAPLTRAAIGAGAQGILIEVTAQPQNALCDANQQLTPPEFLALRQSLQRP